MSMGKGVNQPKPKPTGLDEILVPTSETSVPPSYFAGVRLLNVSWIMDPVITNVQTSSNSGKGK